MHQCNYASKMLLLLLMRFARVHIHGGHVYALLFSLPVSRYSAYWIISMLHAPPPFLLHYTTPSHFVSSARRSTDNERKNPRIIAATSLLHSRRARRVSDEPLTDRLVACCCCRTLSLTATDWNPCVPRRVPLLLCIRFANTLHIYIRSPIQYAIRYTYTRDEREASIKRGKEKADVPPWFYEAPGLA